MDSAPVFCNETGWLQQPGGIISNSGFFDGGTETFDSFLLKEELPYNIQ
jgi:hypothetical protein